MIIPPLFSERFCGESRLFIPQMFSAINKLNHIALVFCVSGKIQANCLLLLVGCKLVQPCKGHPCVSKLRDQSAVLVGLEDKEINIKTTLWYHCTPTIMAGVKKMENIKCWQGCGTTETCILCWWRYYVGTVTLKNHFYKLKLTMWKPYDLTVPLLDIYLTEIHKYVY